MMKYMLPTMGLILVAQESAAGLIIPMGLSTMPSALPLGMGGFAGVAIVSLIIGTQLIKRRK
jgi:membrane protein implicated in regulation of membrane protease activity